MSLGIINEKNETGFRVENDHSVENDLKVENCRESEITFWLITGKLNDRCHCYWKVEHREEDK